MLNNDKNKFSQKKGFLMKISKKPLLAVFLFAVSLSTYAMDEDLDSLIQKYPIKWNLIFNNLHPLSTGIKIVNTYRTQNGRTMLLHAIISKNIQAVKTLLIKYHANPNTPDISGITPLMSACILIDVECVKILLAHGANPSLKFRDGRTCLDFLTVALTPGAPIDLS